MYKANSIHSLLLCIIACCVLVCACSKTENLPPTDFKTSYYPLKINSTIIYKVDSVDYRVFSASVTVPTTYTYELKDSIVRAVTEGDQQTFIIYRYQKFGTGKWNFIKAFTRSLVSRRAEEFIDNQRFVRLIFPPVKDNPWKGNLYNNLDSVSTSVYSITSIDQARKINSIALDSTLVVQEMKNLNLIRKDYAIAVYAKNIGLVKRIVYAVDTFTFPIIDSTKIKEGYTYSMEIKSFK